MTDAHGARLDVRLAHYPNQVMEQAAIASVDEQVFDRVREFERMLVGHAQAFQSRAMLARQRAADAAAELSSLIRDLEEGVIPLDADAARRYERVRNEGQASAAALRRALRESEFHESRARDPYGQFVSLLRRFPALRRPIQP